MNSYRSDAIRVERATNRQYLRDLERKGANFVKQSHSISRPRSADWAGYGRPTPAQIELSPLIGRVKLDTHLSELGFDEFYIGPWFVKMDDSVCISWAAPAADAFYMNEEPPHDYRSHVVARRVFKTNTNDEVVDVNDELVDSHSTSDPFAASSALSVPQAPHVMRRTQPATPAPRAPQVIPTEADEGAPRTSDASPDVSRPSAKQPERVAAVNRKVPQKKPLISRARETVMSLVKDPRRDRLSPMLATMQPDQMSAVKAPADRNVIIEGDPGTGKTIIASHRAAYLVNDQQGDKQNKVGVMQNVLLIGPNDEYQRHVSRVIDSLAPSNRIHAAGVASLMASIAGIPRPGGSPHGEILDFDKRWIRLAEHAAIAAKGDPHFPSYGTTGRRQLIYELIRSNGRDAPLARKPDTLTWMATLPPFESALKRERYLPLFAAIGIFACKAYKRYEHIILDEAQDLRPLEWAVLRRVNRGTWTIIGDPNQRRSDASPMSWKHVEEILVGRESKISFDRRKLETGFRSTQQIMKFAQQLLPRNERTARCVVDDGPEVAVSKHRGADLDKAAVALADALARKYQKGTLAIIAMDLRPLTMQLRNQGWVGEDPRRYQWEKTSDDSEFAQLFLLTPEHARGLEFDAVVVVEPSTLPRNLGARGLLYTSLTRANKELAVVHSNPLPDPLRR